jgi:hypothetical protein
VCISYPLHGGDALSVERNQRDLAGIDRGMIYGVSYDVEESDALSKD